MRPSPRRILHSTLLTFLFLQVVGPGSLQGQGRETLLFQDLMKVRQVRDPSISKDGRWIALAAVPDRGDGEVLVHSTTGDTRFRIPLGSAPVIAPDGRWVAARLGPSFEAQETAADGDRPRSGMALLNTDSGEVLEWEEISSFGFSGAGGWLARLAFAPEGAEGEEPAPSEGPEAQEEDEGRTREEPGTLFTLRHLATGSEVEIPSVKRFSFHRDGPWLAYVVATPTGEGDGVYLRHLTSQGEVEALETGEFLQVRTMAWGEDDPRLAWVSAPEEEDGEAGAGSLSYWDGDGVERVPLSNAIPDGWELPAENRLAWSDDGDRLFFGSRPANPEVEEDGEDEGVFDPYDMERILKGRTVDVWHTDDPLINPNQIRVWSREQARTFLAVHHLSSGETVQLGDTLVQLDGIPDNPIRALASSSVPYMKERTWTGGAEDIYLVDLTTGERTLAVEGYGGQGSAANSWIGAFAESMSLSPGGRFLVWFMGDHWHLLDAETGAKRVLTQGMDVPFYDVDHDYPSPRGGHGVGGWLEGDAAVLIHDKYDVWRFPTDGGAPVNLTGGQGRSRELILRVTRLDPQVEAFSPNGPVPLASFDWRDKSFGFFSTHSGRGGLEALLDEEKRFRVLAKADDADRLLYVREDYDEFPDLWVSDLGFGERRKVTDVNPGLLEKFAWGTARLVEWDSDDGVPLQGVVILPGNYEEGRRYPVLTYFYRFFSQRLHEFNAPVINHRPSFPIYASDGYLVFLPDVRFEVGRPGLSSMKSVVPGVKKLVDLGLADPDALGLHGHS